MSIKVSIKKYNIQMLPKLPLVQKGVYGMIDTVYLISYILGLLPFGRSRAPDGSYVYFPVKISLRSIVPLISLSTTAAIMLYISLKIHMENGRVKGFDHGVLLTLNIFAVIGSLLNTVVALLKQSDFLKCFALIEELDVLFWKIHKKFDYRLGHWATASMGVLSYGTAIAYGPIMHFGLGKPFWEKVFEGFSIYGAFYLMFAMIYFFFVFMVMTVWRLLILNEYLRSLNQKCFNKKIPKGKQDDEKICEAIKIATLIHFKLCEMSQCMNSCMTHAVLFAFFPFSMNMALFLFTFLGDNSSRQAELGLWSCTTGVIMWTVICVSYYTSYLSKKTVKLLAGLEMHSEGKKLSMERFTVLLQIQHYNIEYTAAGLFTLNVKLITEHLSTMTDLLMFLLEMRKQQFGRS